MHGRGLLIWALVLLGVGIIGLVATALLVPGSPASEWCAGCWGWTERDDADRRSPRDYEQDLQGFSSNGERIFFTGVGHEGPIRMEWDPMAERGGFGPRGGRGRAVMGCANCHGRDGQGGRLGMMARVDAPDIRYETLTSAHEEGAESEDAWTDDDIARAIRDGIEPDGDELDPIMPRWDMDDTDMDDLIAYLKELE